MRRGKRGNGPIGRCDHDLVGELSPEVPDGEDARNAGLEFLRVDMDAALVEVQPPICNGAEVG